MSELVKRVIKEFDLISDVSISDGTAMAYMKTIVGALIGLTGFTGIAFVNLLTKNQDLPLYLLGISVATGATAGAIWGIPDVIKEYRDKRDYYNTHK